MSVNETPRAYAAECELREQLETPAVTLHGCTVTVPVERRFAELADVQRYVDLVLALNWVRARYPRAAESITVERSKKINIADCGSGVMRVNPDHSRWAMRETVILHEVAHHLAPLGSAHDVEFRTTYLHLLEELVGPEAAFLMRSNYTDQGLKVAVYI